MDWNALYRAWLDGIVLVVRGQTLTIPEFLAYSSRFGRLKPHRVRRTRHPEYPELTVMGVGTRKADGKVDKTIYDAAAAGTPIRRGTRRSARARSSTASHPVHGGDTLFASMYDAYETLPASLKQRIEGLKAEQSMAGAAGAATSCSSPRTATVRPPCIRSCARTRRPAALRSTPTPITSPASRG